MHRLTNTYLTLQYMTFSFKQYKHVTARPLARLIKIEKFMLEIGNKTNFTFAIGHLYTPLNIPIIS